MRKLSATVLVFLALILLAPPITSMAQDREIKGGAGTEIVVYALNEYGQMVWLSSDYVPARFHQSVIRSIPALGTMLASAALYP